MSASVSTCCPGAGAAFAHVIHAVAAPNRAIDVLEFLGKHFSPIGQPYDALPLGLALIRAFQGWMMRISFKAQVKAPDQYRGSLPRQYPNLFASKTR